MRAQAGEVVAVAVDQPGRVAGEESGAAVEPGRRQERHADIAAADWPGRGRSFDRGSRRRSQNESRRDDEWRKARAPSTPPRSGPSILHTPHLPPDHPIESGTSKGHKSHGGVITLWTR